MLEDFYSASASSGERRGEMFEFEESCIPRLLVFLTYIENLEER